MKIFRYVLTLASRITPSKRHAQPRIRG